MSTPTTRSQCLPLLSKEMEMSVNLSLFVLMKTVSFQIVLNFCKCYVNYNLFTHGALKSSYELVETCPCVPDRIGI